MAVNYSIDQKLLTALLLVWCLPWVLAAISLFVFSKGKNDEKKNGSLIRKLIVKSIVLLPLIMWGGPWIILIIFIWFLIFQEQFFLQDPNNNLGHIIFSFVLVFAFLVSTINLLFLAYLYRSPNVPNEEKGAWVRKFAFSQVRAIPRFWYKYMWKIYN